MRSPSKRVAALALDEGRALARAASPLCLPLHADRRLIAERGVFHSLFGLQVAINRFMEEANANPRPFRWTKDPDSIIAADKRGLRHWG